MKIISNIDVFPDEFPTEIMALILARLPVESIQQCKSVSRRWYSLISSTYFINLHLNHNRSLHHHDPNSNYFLVAEHVNKYTGSRLECKALNSNLTPCKEIIIPEVMCADNGDYVHYVRGSCNGLVTLLYSYLYHDDEKNFHTGYDVVLWNPSTNNYATLPFVECPPGVCGRGCVDIGIGYDISNDDYKVVRVYYTPPRDQFVVYSLKHNSWGKPVFLDDCSFMDYKGGVLTQNHILHWLCSDHIRSFDVCSETWSDLALPVVDEHHDRPVDLRALHDCLCLVSNSRQHECHEADVWVMKECDAKESSWFKLCRITGVDLLPKGLHSSPIAYSKRGQEILLQIGGHSDGNLFWYNLRDKTLKVASKCGCSRLHLCVASLVPLEVNDIVVKRAQRRNEYQDEAGRILRGALQA